MQEFEKMQGKYIAFTSIIEKLLKELLKEHGIKVHSVKSRVKDKESLRKNLDNSEKQVTKLEDIIDISGLRIITNFSDDVTLVEKMIDKEFNVNKKLSSNKMDLLDPDRFGYVSLHKIVKLLESRLKLTEYKRFRDFQCEIQIRSILQHAWAEIEHDLGYKTTLAVPKQIRRKFSRLAGLLEIADDEFDQIRRSLMQYEKEVSDQIIKSPETVLINKASLTSFIESSSLIKTLDDEIAKIIGAKIRDEIDIDEHLKRLQYIGLETIAQISTILKESSSDISKFAKSWLAVYNPCAVGGFFKKGISLFYLSLYLVGKVFSDELILEFFKTFKMMEGRNVTRALQRIKLHANLQ